MGSILNRSTYLSVVGLLLVTTGCGPQNGETSPGAPARQTFGEFASDLFAELQTSSITDELSTQIGLFGDLDVMSGEHVVMGRYRYRIDTTNGTPEASMAFLMRAEGVDSLSRAYGGAPVILSFGEAGGQWQLSETRYVPRPDTPDVMAAALEEHLEHWAATAVQRTNER